MHGLVERLGRLLACLGELIRFSVKGPLCLARRLLQLGQFLHTFIDRLRVRPEMGGDHRKLVDRRAVLAGGGAQSEQPLLNAFQLLGVEVRDAEGALKSRACFLERLQCLIQRFHRHPHEVAGLGSATLEPPQYGGERGYRRGRSSYCFVRVTQIVSGLLSVHQRGAAIGERLLLACLRCEAGKFFHRVSDEIRFCERALQAVAFCRYRLFAFLPDAPAAPDFRCALGIAAKRVEQRAVRGRIDERAFVVLAVDLDKPLTHFAQYLNGHGLIVDEGARAAIRELHAAQDEVAVRIEIVRLQHGARRVTWFHIERCSDLTLLGPLPDKCCVTPCAEREREGVKHDRLARTRFAREDGQVRREVEIEPINQDDVADREVKQHGRGNPAAILSQVPRGTATPLMGLSKRGRHGPGPRPRCTIRARHHVVMERSS